MNYDLANMIADLVGATQIKKWVCYSGVPALHSAAEVVIKCPSGLLSAYFLAIQSFSSWPLPGAESWRRRRRSSCHAWIPHY